MKYGEPAMTDTPTLPAPNVAEAERLLAKAVRSHKTRPHLATLREQSDG